MRVIISNRDMREILLLAIAGIALIVLGLTFDTETNWYPARSGRTESSGAALSSPAEDGQLTTDGWTWDTILTDSTVALKGTQRDGLHFLRN